MIETIISMFEIYFEVWKQAPIIFSMTFIWCLGFNITFISNNSFKRSLLWFVPKRYLAKEKKPEVKD